MLTITADRDGNVSAYQDGILRGQTTFTVGGDPSAPFIGDLSTPHPWVIMQHGAVEDPQVGPYDKDFAGKLANIKIYSRVLSEGEVEDLFAEEMISTSINEVGLAFTESKPYVYPNPTSNNVTLHLNLLKSKFTSVKLFNSTGQQLKVLQQGNMNEGEQELTYDVSDLSQGLYLLIVEQGTSKAAIKFVINTN